MNVNAVLVDLAEARSAVQMAAKQVAELVRSPPDPRASVPGLDWTLICQTAAHMVAALRRTTRVATGQATPETTIDLREGNLERIRQVDSQDLTELADLLVGKPIATSNGRQIFPPTTVCPSLAESR